MGRLRRGIGGVSRADRLDLERRLARCMEERSPLRMEPEELYGQFLSASPALDEARGEARRGRMEVAAEALLEHFHDRIRPIFFLHYSEPDLLRPRLEEHPGDCRALLQGADALLGHQFSPLGVEPFTFSSAIDWFSDFQGQSWVCAHVEDLRDQFAGRRPAPAVDMGPIEVTWEFNRHSHFVHLGRAYWLTGNERFASEFIVQVVDWTERNRACEGVNWLDPATVARRCTNWLLALHMFLGSDQLTADLLSRILSSLVLHGAVLAHHLRHDEEPGLATASGLYVLALSMPELRLSRRWLALAGPAVARAAAGELGRDGLHRSGSVARHRLACEWLLLPLALHLLNGSTPPAGLPEAAEAALEALGHLRAPGGLVAEVGPPAPPGFLGLGCGPSEHARRLLALGALTTRRGDLRHGMADMPGEMLWWFGPTAGERFQGLRAHEPGTGRRLFAEVGLACARDRWDAKASWCLLRGAPPPGGFPEGRLLPPGEAERAIAHDDPLGLCLTLDGEPVLIEPGTPQLAGPVTALLSRVASHSAPRLPGEMEPLSTRSLDEDHPASRELRVEDWKDGVYLTAVRQVWAEPDNPWPLRREVLFQPKLKTAIVRDHVGGHGEAVVELNFLLSPHLEVLMRGDMGCLLRGKRLYARIHPLFPTRFRYNTARGETKPFAGWYWSETCKVAPTTRLRYFTKLKLPTTLYVWIGWDPRDSAVPRGKDLDRLFEGR